MAEDTAPPSPPISAARPRDLVERAIARRSSLIGDPELEVYRLLCGDAEGLPGVVIDRFGRGAVLATQRDRGSVAERSRELAALARAAFPSLQQLGIAALYGKPGSRDRTRPPALATDPCPLAGAALPPALLAREHGRRYEVRLYDGLATGLFVDQRDNRRALAHLGARSALNLFAYTCAFSVALARAGAAVTSVDVSQRALDWGKRNFAANGLPVDDARFVRLDARRFLDHAIKRGLRYELVIVDPPTFGASSTRRGVRAWSIERDLSTLLAQAARCVAAGGRLFVASNTRALCRPGALRRLVGAALAGQPPLFLPLPEPPLDLPGESCRAASELLLIGG